MADDLVDVETKGMFDNHIIKLIEDNLYLAQGKVKSIDLNDYSCEVQVSNNIMLKKVALRGINSELDDDEDTYDVRLPKIDSIVWCAVNRRTAIIYDIKEVEKTVLKRKSLVTTIEEARYQIISDRVNFHIDNDNGKIFINTDNENEPVTRGNKAQEHIDNLYDYADDLYDKMLTHIHPTIMGPSGTVIPPISADIILKRVDIVTDKGNSVQVKSTKNFTE